MTAEELLVKRALSGDEKAFEQIVLLYQNTVYSSALYYSRTAEDALDISQEVFLRLWKTRESFRGDASIKTWIATLTKNCAIDLLRERGKRDLLSLSEDDEGKAIDVADDSVDSDPAKSYERKTRIEAVRKAVESLDEPIRETLILREFHGLSYAEIASALKISEGTVKSRISRGRDQVKDFLKRGNFL